MRNHILGLHHVTPWWSALSPTRLLGLPQKKRLEDKALHLGGITSRLGGEDGAENSDRFRQLFARRVQRGEQAHGVAAG